MSKNSKICDNFQNVFDSIKRYVKSNQEAENIRSLVCGILWVDDYIVINTRQLQHVIGKCKSSINNGIQAIGYVSIQTSADIAVILGKKFPFLKNNFSEMRQWTVRRLQKKEHIDTAEPSKPVVSNQEYNDNVINEDQLFGLIPDEKVPFFELSSYTDLCIGGFDGFGFD